MKYFLLLCVAGLTACGTVSPDPVLHNRASNSGTVANSGVLAIVRGKDGKVTGRTVDQGWVDYYNDLIEKRGKEFIPPMQKNDGVTPNKDGSYFVDRQHAVRYEIMNSEEGGGI